MYPQKAYILIWLVVSVGVSLVSLTAAGCNHRAFRYTWHGTTRANAIVTKEKGVDHLSFPSTSLLAVDDNGMTRFCQAIKEGSYEKLRYLLNAISLVDGASTEDIVYLITGCKANKEARNLYPQRALLEQVVTSSEPEILAHKQELLILLCGIFISHGGELNQAFCQKHGKDRNTLIHLAVDTASLDTLASLVNCYLRKSNNDINGLIKVCTIPNRLGRTPIWMLMDMLYNGKLTCGHIYRNECESHHEYEPCENELFIASHMEEILTYLLELGVPWCEQKKSKTKSVFHYVMEHDDAYLFKDMLESIKKRTTNKIQKKDLLGVSDTKGLSLLSHAVINRNYQGVRYLIRLGACPMTSDGKGIFPLFYALAYADTKMVKYLSEAPCILEGTCNINQS